MFSLLSGRFYAKYKNRVPDPGVFAIVSLDWERRRLTISNGACRYFPTFDEVVITDSAGSPYTSVDDANEEIRDAVASWFGDNTRNSDLAEIRNRLCNSIATVHDLRAALMNCEADCAGLAGEAESASRDRARLRAEVSRLRDLLRELAASRPDAPMEESLSPELVKWILDTCERSITGLYPRR